ncbi:MAG: phosphatidate cytidylyltransferase [Coriobacteriia bacterium]
MSAPSRMSGLPTRIATALAIGVAFLAAILYGHALGLGVLLAVVAVLAASEFYTITRRESRLPNEVFGLVAVFAMPLSAALWGVEGLAGTVATLVAASLVWHLAFKRVSATDTAVTVFGAVYVGFSLAHLVLIRGFAGGWGLTLATVVSVWANDVFAYAVGASLGKHRLAPHISPNKTWEGFAAGTVFTVGVWIVVGLVEPTFSLAGHALVGVAVSIAAVVGDLAESRLKREAGIKDSGTRLPGHGGFLDRFDSLIMVSLVTYYLLLLAGAR